MIVGLGYPRYAPSDATYLGSRQIAFADAWYVADRPPRGAVDHRGRLAAPL
jgi:hypothetical protein